MDKEKGKMSFIGLSSHCHGKLVISKSGSICRTVSSA